MMEGNVPAAPRLARDFYTHYGWPLPGRAAFEEASAEIVQASLLDADNDLQTPNYSPASATTVGQAGVRNGAPAKVQASPNAAVNRDLPQQASAPEDGGHASINAADNVDLHPPISLEEASVQPAQAFLLVADLDLLQPACAPIDGRAGVFYEADFNLHGASASKHASFPEAASAFCDGGQASNTAVNVDLQPANSSEKGTFPSIDCTLPFQAAPCGMPICNQQDISLLQGGLRRLAAHESFDGHAATLLQQAASSIKPFPPAAHTKASSPALSSSSSAISTVSIHSSPTPTSANPALIPIHVANPHPRRSVEVLQTSSPNILTSLQSSSTLRAQASPWKPGRPTLPSLLVGDIPLLPISSSPKFSHPLLLPVRARQSLASLHHPVETLGVGQPLSCPFCGHISCYPSGGSPTSTAFGFSRLRGRNGVDQAQDSKVAVHHHGTDPARRSTRPRCKMKSELKGLRIHKATLDPG